MAVQYGNTKQSKNLEVIERLAKLCWIWYNAIIKNKNYTFTWMNDKNSFVKYEELKIVNIDSSLLSVLKEVCVMYV